MERRTVGFDSYTAFYSPSAWWIWNVEYGVTRQSDVEWRMRAEWLVCSRCRDFVTIQTQTNRARETHTIYIIVLFVVGMISSRCRRHHTHMRSLWASSPHAPAMIWCFGPSLNRDHSVPSCLVTRHHCTQFLWCRDIVDDVGDHAMSEHSVLWSPDELCWAHVILPRCTHTIRYFSHWRRQLWGTGARAPPPRLPASYFWDHSLYRLWPVLRTVFCPVERFLAIGSADCHWIVALLSQPLQMGEGSGVQFSSGSNYSSQNAGTIANKFQLHTYFRFR